MMKTKINNILDTKGENHVITRFFFNMKIIIDFN